MNVSIRGVLELSSPQFSAGGIIISFESFDLSLEAAVGWNLHVNGLLLKIQSYKVKC